MIHRPSELVGALVRALEIGIIRVYRATLSGWLGGGCRFYPTCSRYTEEAIREHGGLKGPVLGAWRILRCNPFGAGGIDHVPPAVTYEGVIPAPDLTDA